MATIKKIGCIRVKPNQFEMIVKAMELNPMLNGTKITSRYTTAKRNEDWQELSKKLNSIGGAIKSVKCWQKTWADKKSEAKKRVKNWEAARLNGEERNEDMKLTPLEKRIGMLLTNPPEGLNEQESELMPEIYVIPKVDDCSECPASESSCFIATLLKSSQPFTQESTRIVLVEDHLPDTPSRLPDIEEPHQPEPLPPRSKTPQAKDVNAQKPVQTGMATAFTRCAEALEEYNKLQEIALEIKKRKTIAQERALEIEQQKADAFVEIVSLLKNKF